MPVWGWIIASPSSRSQSSLSLRARFPRADGRRICVTASAPSTTAWPAPRGASATPSRSSEREERREELGLKTLPEASRERYREWWRTVQAQFVDDPRSAIRAADDLIQSVMAERGYPAEEFEQRAADLSVDHPDLVQNYRQGHRLAETSRDNGASTEARQAMVHYRALFEELVEPLPGARAA